MTIAELQELSPDELIQVMGPAGMAQRYREWQEQWAAESGAPGYMCDIDHHPNSKGGTPGHNFPVQLCHGHILCFGCGADEWKIATGKEHMVANAFHSLDAAASKQFPVCPLMSVLDAMDLKECQLKAMSGNGMNLFTQSAWMMYVMSHIERIDQTVVHTSSETAVSGDDW